jgi:hypothetical protein
VSVSVGGFALRKPSETQSTPAESRAISPDSE